MATNMDGVLLTREQRQEAHAMHLDERIEEAEGSLERTRLFLIKDMRTVRDRLDASIQHLQDLVTHTDAWHAYTPDRPLHLSTVSTVILDEQHLTYLVEELRQMRRDRVTYRKLTLY